MIEEDVHPVLLPRPISEASFSLISDDISEELTDCVHAATADTSPSSKRIVKRRVTAPKERNMNTALSFRDYVPGDDLLKTYRIAELKSVAKFNRLHITGTKPVLIDRIETFFRKNVQAVKIQKTLRRFFVRRSFQLRGKGFRERSLCVNETDFYTLEPLDEIPWQAFYSYTDSGNFTYGFNLCSLITLLKRKGRSIINPYNRAKFPPVVIGNAIRLYLYMLTLFTEHANEEDLDVRTRNAVLMPVNVGMLVRGYYYGFYAERDEVPSLQVTNRIVTRFTSPPPTFLVPPRPHLPTHLRFDDDELPPFMEPAAMQDAAGATTAVVHNEVVNAGTPNVHIHVTSETVQAMRQNLLRIQELRTQPLATRVNNLFMEIDQLGNYTSSTWFTDLPKTSHFLFYISLYETWRYRGRLSHVTKLRMCPWGDPFANVMSMRTRIENISEEEMSLACVTAMENLILSAVDIEDRRLGALLVLQSLTRYSVPARNNMMWLYESIM